MSIQQDSLQFAGHLLEILFEQRDIQGFMSFADERTTWLGFGDGLCRGLRAAADALTGRMPENVPAVREHSLEAQALSPMQCIVYGAVSIAYRPGESREMPVTLVCTRVTDGMRLLHCNLAWPDCGGGASDVGERAPGAVRTPQETQNLLMKHVPGGAHRCKNDLDFTILEMSDGFLSMFGYTRAEVYEQFHDHYVEMIFAGDRAEVVRKTRRQLQKGRILELEYRVLCKDGRLVWVLDKGCLAEDEAGGQSLYCILVEISDRKREQEKLRLSLERHKVILDQATDIIFEWDMENDTLLFSSNWRIKFGYEPISRDISRQTLFSQNIHPEDRDAVLKNMRALADGTPYLETEMRIRNVLGQYLWCRVRATVQFDSERSPIKTIGVIVDISAQKRERQQLWDLAHRDALTGLYNKAAVRELVEERMRRGAGCLPQALFIIDLDNFKLVNDTYGHLCGDALLTEVAEILKKHFRTTDVVGRIGGDEFLAYIPEVTRPAAESKARELLKHLGQIRPAQEAAPVSCSIGAALFTRGGIDYFGLYQCADRALYHQKSQGKGGVVFYDPLVCNDSMPCGRARSSVSAVIDSDVSGGGEEKLAQFTFRTLYRSLDIHKAVCQLLEVVGRSYNVSRVFIFEDSEDGTSCSNTFEWRMVNMPSLSGGLERFSYQKDLAGYRECFGADGIFYCRDVRTLPPKLAEFLQAQGLCSLLQCAVMDAGRFRGYVGFGESNPCRFWDDEQVHTLALTANVLAVFLTKLRLEERLKRITEKALQDRHVNC